MSELTPWSRRRPTPAGRVFVTFALALAATIIVLALLAPVTVLGYSLYSVWLRGYGIGCASQTKSDVISPSGRWTARIRHAECFGVGASGPWVDVVLISNDRPRVLARRRAIFERSLDGPKHGSEAVAVKWIDDYTLELNTPTCAPRCETWDDKAMRSAPTGLDPCEAACWSTSAVASVKVSIRPAEH